MEAKELKKLSRSELLEMLLDRSKDIENLVTLTVDNFTLTIHNIVKLENILTDCKVSGFDLFLSALNSICEDKKQVQALSDNVEDNMHEAGYSHKGVEGYSEGGWILLDYYDIIIHIFSEESRRFYNIEKIWSDGDIVSLDSI